MTTQGIRPIKLLHVYYQVLPARSYSGFPEFAIYHNEHMDKFWDCESVLEFNLVPYSYTICNGMEPGMADTGLYKIITTPQNDYQISNKLAISQAHVFHILVNTYFTKPFGYDVTFVFDVESHSGSLYLYPENLDHLVPYTQIIKSVCTGGLFSKKVRRVSSL